LPLRCLRDRLLLTRSPDPKLGFVIPTRRGLGGLDCGVCLSIPGTFIAEDAPEQVLSELIDSAENRS
jgi:hypothetical protein